MLIEEHSNWLGLSLDERSLVYDHIWHQKLLIVPVKFVVLKVTDVHTTVCHYHSTLKSFVVFPLSFEDAPV